MGLFLDQLEDSAEQLGSHLRSLEGMLSGYHPRWSAHEPVFTCPVCNEHCLGEEQYIAHTRERHHGQRVYLSLDGVVITGTLHQPDDGELHWLEQGVRDCRLRLVGHPSAEVDICLGARRYHEVLVDRGAIDRLLPEDYEGPISIVVTPPVGPSHHFLLYSKVPPPLEHDPIDETILKTSREFETGGRLADLLDVRSELLDLAGENSQARTYANGLLEYLLGRSIEQGPHPRKARRHFEDALGRLRPFTTPLAQTVRRLLALQMNAFGLLRDVPPTSRFAGVAAFFKFPESPCTNPGVQWSPMEAGVSVRDEILLLFDCVRAYHGQDYHQAISLGAHLAQGVESDDINALERKNLILARSHRRLDDAERASRYYQHLAHTSLCFRQEGEEFMRCRR